jgi:hypothetical protein
MKIKFVFLAGVLSALLVYGADKSEKDVPTSPLTIWSAGIGAGGFIALNDEQSMKSERLLKMSFLNSIYITDQINLFGDLNWFAPGPNFGVDVGIDFLPMTGRFSPILGVGVGAHHFDRKDQDFGQNFGPSITGHVGFLLEVTETMQLQVRLPVYLVANKIRYRTAGVDIGLLFSRPYRHVKKLTY